MQTQASNQAEVHAAFGVVNSTLTLIKVPSGKNMKKKTENAGNPKKQKNIYHIFKHLVEWVVVASPVVW